MFWALFTGVEIIALSWRCAHLWYWEHIDGSSDSVLGRALSTSRQPRGGTNCGGWRSSHKLGLLFLEVQGGVLLKSKAPLSCASADSLGLILDGLIRFKVRVGWLGREGGPKGAAENQGHSW